MTSVLALTFTGARNLGATLVYSRVLPLQVLLLPTP